MKATQLRALIAAQPWLADEEWFTVFASMILSESFGKETEVSSKKETASSERLVTSGVGIVPISGPIFNQPNFLTELLGIGTTYSKIKKQVSALLSNDEVDKLLLDIDSPGGVVSGVNETSSIITKANEQKPVYSYVGGVGASAAYWLMSGSKEIAIDATARVGSIGVVASFLDPKYDPEIEIVNSASPNKRPDVSKDEGKKVIIEELDALADVFIGTVATNRGVSEKTVKSDFGKGGCLVGNKAVNAGMADKVSFFSDFLEEIKTGDSSKESSSESLVYDVDSSDGSTSTEDNDNDNNSNEEDVFMDVKTLKEKHPDVYKAIVDEASAEANAKVETLQAENDSLKQSVASHQETNTALNDRMKALEKSDAIRAEKDLKAEADNMVNASLAKSNLHARTHNKVANQLDHNKFVTDGKLDREGFQKAIDDEIADWEGIVASSGDVQGMSFSTDQNADDQGDAEVDATVDRMVGYLN